MKVCKDTSETDCNLNIPSMYDHSIPQQVQFKPILMENNNMFNDNIMFDMFNNSQIHEAI